MITDAGGGTVPYTQGMLLWLQMREAVLFCIHMECCCGYKCGRRYCSVYTWNVAVVTNAGGGTVPYTHGMLLLLQMREGVLFRTHRECCCGYKCGREYCSVYTWNVAVVTNAGGGAVPYTHGMLLWLQMREGVLFRTHMECCCGYKCGRGYCSVHTWNDHLQDSLPHLIAVVTPETCR